jgi:hypothetical protein
MKAILLVLTLLLSGCVVASEPIEYTPYPQTYYYAYPAPYPVYGGWGWHRRWRR